MRKSISAVKPPMRSKPSKRKGAKIAIVLPVLDEEKAIGKVLDEIVTAMHEFKHDVIVVDGHSTDRTVNIAKSKGAKVIFQWGKGYGDALATALDYASVNRIPLMAMLDGDGTYKPSDLPKMIEAMEQTAADIVVGNRFANRDPESFSAVYSIGNRALSWFARVATGIKVQDTQSGLRLLRTDAVQRLDLGAGGMPFATEMLVEAHQAGAKVSEVPVSYRARIGSKKVGALKHGASILVSIVRLMRDYRPILFFGGFGAILMAAGGLVGVRVVVEWLTTQAITHLASVMLSALLIMSGVQTVTLSLVADMIRKNREFMRKST